MNIPKYTISDIAVCLVGQINRLLGESNGFKAYTKDLYLRKVNRLRTIQSSLAIENNTLTLEEVTAVINGKHVIGHPREIQEVKNAFEAYEHLSDYNPYDVEDFLRAHKYMASLLVEEAGCFRTKPVGVFCGRQLIHKGADVEVVPQLIKDLLAWARNTDIDPLIKSSIVHFQIEMIHPFIDGNGRMGRLWQTLLLTKWEPAFEWIPIETMIYEQQQRYYDALGSSEKEGDARNFIDFMLLTILQTLEVQSQHQVADIITDTFKDINPDELSEPEKIFLIHISKFLLNKGSISNLQAQMLTAKSATIIKQYFSKLVSMKILLIEGNGRNKKYLLNEEKLKDL